MFLLAEHECCGVGFTWSRSRSHPCIAGSWSVVC